MSVLAASIRLLVYLGASAAAGRRQTALYAPIRLREFRCYRLRAPLWRPFSCWKRCGLSVALALLPCALFAHGVESYYVTEEAGCGVELVRFVYSTGEPMAYVTIKLFPPSTPEADILQAVSDRNGYFSFVPDEEGDWLVTAEDGMGHKGELVVKAAAVKAQGDGGAGGAGGKLPLPFAALFGLSLLANCWILFYYLSRLRRRIGRVKGKSDAY